MFKPALYLRTPPIKWDIFLRLSVLFVEFIIGNPSDLTREKKNEKNPGQL